MKLPDGRYVPSTRRWNLVWADQIIPNQVSTAQVEFAARNYVATQKIWSGQAAGFRAFNRNFIVVAYHLAAGLNPLHNSDAPDPKSRADTGFIGVIAPAGYLPEYSSYFLPWLNAAGIAEGSGRYEAMFQHYDSPADMAHRVWHQDPYWLMNIENDDWTDYNADVTLDWMRGNRNEGCFFDVAVEMNTSLYNPKRSNPAPRNFDWWMSPHGPSGYVGTIAGYPDFDDWQNPRYLRYFQKLYKRFHTDSVDYLVLPNVDQMVTTVYDPLWIDGDAEGPTIDGAMMESFGGYRGFDMWQTLERGLRHITGRGRILIAQFSAPTSSERLRRVAMYMLIKNENSFLNIINGGGVEWYPEYEIDLGDQSPVPADLASMRVAGNGSSSLWRRDYQRGIVLVNTAEAPIGYDLPAGDWRRIITEGGGRVGVDGVPRADSIRYEPVAGSVTVPASDGVILQRVDDASSVDEPLEDGGSGSATGPDLSLRLVR
jgi:hypothetical protein